MHIERDMSASAEVVLSFIVYNSIPECLLYPGSQNYLSNQRKFL